MFNVSYVSSEAVSDDLFSHDGKLIFSSAQQEAIEKFLIEGVTNKEYYDPETGSICGVILTQACIHLLKLSKGEDKELYEIVYNAVFHVARKIVASAEFPNKFTLVLAGQFLTGIPAQYSDYIKSFEVRFDESLSLVAVVETLIGKHQILLCEPWLYKRIIATKGDTIEFCVGSYMLIFKCVDGQPELGMWIERSKCW